MATKAQVIKYAVLPGILPRLFALLKSGFAFTAYMMAIIYGNTRLLPPNHAYLNPANIGRYGMRHVIIEAANHLVFKRKNIDQIIIFFTILAGLVLLILQFALVILALVAEQHAYAITITDLFANPGGTIGSLGPDQDLAFIVMDRVFGVTGFFDSCIANTGVQCEDLNGNPLPSTPTAYPFPFHLALHQILQFYSYGIFIVAVFVIIYYVTTSIAETAANGTPFGQRFNKAWVPIRIIVFMALIIPINFGGPNEGLNPAQLIVFQAVKLGSNMATNGWVYFNGGGPSGGLSNSYMTQQLDVVAEPNIPEVNDLLHTIYVARTCAAAYGLSPSRRISGPPSPAVPPPIIDAYIVRNDLPPALGAPNGNIAKNTQIFAGTGFNAARAFAAEGNLKIRFGEYDPGYTAEHSKEFDVYKGRVKPLCGEVTILMQGLAEPGAQTITQGYYDMLQQLWGDPDFIQRAECVARRIMPTVNDPTCTPVADQTFAQTEINQYEAMVRTAVQNGIAAQQASPRMGVPNNILRLGWAGASIWYNRIAEMNGAVTTATLNIPKASRIPHLMDVALRQNTAENEFVSLQTMFKQNRSGGNDTNILLDLKPNESALLRSMVSAHDFWYQNAGGRRASFTQKTGNAVIDFVNYLLGTSGLFEMRDNTDVHPLAQLTSLGKGMSDAVFRNIGYGVALAGISGVSSIIDETFAAGASDSASKFFFTLSIVTLGMSVILYYVLPFLPFMYFLFAISGWIKSIFEAIVAMPLWALAHIRVDGEGLPGPGASNGYFLILEIFLRPILIIVGFIASISVFAALVSVLNQIFDLVVANVGGFDEQLEGDILLGLAPATMPSFMDLTRGPIDEFFYTAIYVIIVYMMGITCFKLIDMIPNQIMRWMGVSVSTLQENLQDPAGQLTSQTYRGSILVGNQLTGNIRGDAAVLV